MMIASAYLMRGLIRRWFRGVQSRARLRPSDCWNLKRD